MKKIHTFKHTIFNGESALSRMDLSTSIFNDIFLKIAVFTMLIQTFVISNIIKGLMIYFVVILIKFVKDLFLKPNRFRYLLYFLAVFIGYQLLVQLLNAWYQPQFWDLPTRIIVSPEEPSRYLFRSSLFTQSMYLITCVIFFIYMMQYLKKEKAVETLLSVARWGIILYLAYGVYEFIGFILTGENVDFMSNRIVQVDKIASMFQTIQLGSISFQRMDSLSAEPSMFAYSLMPFTILFYYLRDRIYILLVIVLLLSTSTTAILGLFLFIVIENLFFRKSLRFTVFLALLMVVMGIVYNKILIDFWELTISKVTMSEDIGSFAGSGLERFLFFKSSLNFFLDADILHKLFGHGFGYIRSTDSISTLLVNVGLIGTILYILFVTYPFFKIPLDNDYRRGLFISSIVLLILTLISVTELYFFHIWFFAALSWFEYFKAKGIINNTNIEPAL